MAGTGDLIRVARDARGWSQADLAQAISRSPSAVSRLEAGQQQPTLEMVNELAAVLPVSVDQVLVSMGVHLSGPRCREIPTRLVDALLAMSPQQLAAIQQIAVDMTQH